MSGLEKDKYWRALIRLR
jgi:hypothetical protein